MNNDKIKFVKTVIPTRHRANSVSAVYVLMDDIDTSTFRILKNLYRGHTDKLPDGRKIITWNFGDPKKPNLSIINSQWDNIYKAMEDIGGILVNDEGMPIDKYGNPIEDVISNEDYDAANEAEEVINELEVIIDNAPIEASDVKQKLLQFKQDLINCVSSEDFKRKMMPIIDKAASLGHKFSLGNMILIMVQDPNATYVKSKYNWRTKWKRFVKPDAPAIWLWVPVGKGVLDGETKEQIIYDYLKKYKVKSVKDLPPGIQEEMQVKLRTYIGSRFKLTPSFYDIRFTEVIKGEEDTFTSTLKSRDSRQEIPWFDGTSNETQQTKKLFNIILEIVKEHRIQVGFVDDMGGSRGVSMSGRIDLLKNQPINAGYVNTITHEFAHELLHQKYLSSQNEDLVNYFVGTEKGRKVVEQQAELCAWIVLRNYGFDMPTNINYVGLWGLNEDNAVEIFDSVANTASYIVNKINDKINKGQVMESKQLYETFLPSGQELANMLGYGKIYQASLENEMQMNDDENIQMNQEPIEQEPQMNMESMQIKLSESEFKDFITEAVKIVLSELDWRTYHNAAMKDYDKKRAQKFADMRDSKFNSEYGYEDSKNGNYIRMQGNYNDPRLEMITNANYDADRTHYIKHNGDKNYAFNKNYTSGYEKLPNPNGDKKLARKMTKAHDAFNSINNKYQNGKYDDGNKTDFHAFLGKNID